MTMPVSTTQMRTAISRGGYSRAMVPVPDVCRQTVAGILMCCHPCRGKKGECFSVDGDHDLGRFDHGVDLLANGNPEVLHGRFRDDCDELAAAVQRDDYLCGDHAHVNSRYFSGELVPCT